MDAHVRDLRYFLAVADELHFTRAAQRLFVSQPGLSKQIRTLEQHLRAPLFLRGPGGVALTAAGRALLPHARQVVAAWDAARTAVAEAVAADARSLVLGLTISVGRGLIPATLRRFSERHPDWQVDLRQAGFGEAIVHDRAGSADVAFCWLPLPDDRGLDHRVLLTEPRHVALPVDHPLVRQDVVDIGQLLDEPFLALPESAGPQRAFWLAVDDRGGIPPRVAAVVHGPEETIEALGRGIGVALIAAGNGELYRRPEFVVRPVTGLGPCHLAVVWRRADHRDAVRDFVDSCLHAAEEVRDQAASPAR